MRDKLLIQVLSKKLSKNEQPFPMGLGNSLLYKAATAVK
jgi:hypothetical protein